MKSYTTSDSYIDKTDRAVITIMDPLIHSTCHIELFSFDTSPVSLLSSLHHHVTSAVSFLFFSLKKFFWLHSSMR